MANREVEGPMEIALVGDLSENQTSLCEKLLEVESGGECVLYIDSLGGSPYVAMAITTLILIRDLRNRHRGRRVLVGRSVALRRLRKAFGHALQRPSFPPHEVAERGERGPGRGHGMGQAFPPTRERHGSPAGRHVPCAVQKIHAWCNPGRYIPGRDLAEAGLAELIELRPLEMMRKKRRR